MQDLAVRWTRMNTHTFNRSGLEKFSKELERVFSIFHEEVKWAVLSPYVSINPDGRQEEHPLGDTIVIQKRPGASKQVLLVCHMDTVYPLEHPFQEVKMIDDNRITGPGIADAKGGIIVLFYALQALEQSPLSRNIGWKVILNSDEEIGSPSSAHLFEGAAKEFHWGLVFEPCLKNGHLVGARKGSGHFTILARGRPAHAGRSIREGRNAIDALAKCVSLISRLGDARRGLTVNAGLIRGGSAPNVVAETASAVYNIRFAKAEDFIFVEKKIHEILTAVSQKTEVSIEYQRRVSAGPKPLIGKTLDAFKHVQRCGREIGLDLKWEDSGGVCDGNRLQAAGLATVDTLGVQGGDLHSDHEYLLVDSLVERTTLATLCLLTWADGEWSI